eukprot:2471307-Rhodomonas_salina.2
MAGFAPGQYQSSSCPRVAVLSGAQGSEAPPGITQAHAQYAATTLILGAARLTDLEQKELAPHVLHHRRGRLVAAYAPLVLQSPGSIVRVVSIRCYVTCALHWYCVVCSAMPVPQGWREG